MRIFATKHHRTIVEYSQFILRIFYTHFARYFSVLRLEA